MTSRRNGLRPLELFDTSEARATVDIAVGKRSAWLRGKGLVRLLKEIDSPYMWCPRYHQLTCPVDRVADLLALLEYRDRRVVVLTTVDR